MINISRAELSNIINRKRFVLIIFPKAIKNLFFPLKQPKSYPE